ncbi:Peroxisomal biogenesis factor 2 [Nakaseomyces bracarensis]|uniref:RING-type E3 ubiquitin transferase (cysteine targeting) n=1 Tax=Nakaseomyces bracarensis TaxID=273131 RepID=A0ABR4NQV4_9SACH
MSRVAQLDSVVLDQELDNIVWSRFQKQLQLSSHQEEWQFLVRSLVFLCGTRATGTVSTSTYGSRLSGVLYLCRRRTLFISSILLQYLQRKLSNLYFNSNNVSERSMKVYRWLSTLYGVLDLTTFLRFLLSDGNTKYLSLTNRLLGVVSSVDLLSPSSFYEDTVYAGLEYQNRQLLWNALLEVFNTTLLNSNSLIWDSTRKVKNNKAHMVDERTCPECNGFPVNPYRSSCCSANYCYVCGMKALARKHCSQCGNKDLTMNQIY